jgi:hypothetical protein
MENQNLKCMWRWLDRINVKDHRRRARLSQMELSAFVGCRSVIVAM